MAPIKMGLKGVHYKVDFCFWAVVEIRAILEIICKLAKLTPPIMPRQAGLRCACLLTTKARIFRFGSSPQDLVIRELVVNFYGVEECHCAHFITTNARIFELVFLQRLAVTTINSTFELWVVAEFGTT